VALGLLRHGAVRTGLVFVALLAACGDNSATQPDAGSDAAPIAQGSEAESDLVVNELAPQGDWVELHNRSESDIDLCDFFLTDSMDRLDHYLALGGAAPPDDCAPHMMAAGAYLVIATDDGSGEGHAPFKLGLADEVHVALWTGEVVDGLLYIMTGDAGQSLARQPDGAGLFFAAEPTPGEANQ
jgi:lamin tail-like protein